MPPAAARAAGAAGAGPHGPGLYQRSFRAECGVWVAACALGRRPDGARTDSAPTQRAGKGGELSGTLPCAAVCVRLSCAGRPGAARAAAAARRSSAARRARWRSGQASAPQVKVTGVGGGAFVAARLCSALRGGRPGCAPGAWPAMSSVGVPRGSRAPRGGAREWGEVHESHVQSGGQALYRLWRRRAAGWPAVQRPAEADALAVALPPGAPGPPRGGSGQPTGETWGIRRDATRHWSRPKHRASETQTLRGGRRQAGGGSVSGRGGRVGWGRRAMSRPPPATTAGRPPALTGRRKTRTPWCRAGTARGRRRRRGTAWARPRCTPGGTRRSARTRRH
jgi:hypothetical protein